MKTLLTKSLEKKIGKKGVAMYDYLFKLLNDKVLFTWDKKYGQVPSEENISVIAHNCAITIVNYLQK